MLTIRTTLRIFYFFTLIGLASVAIWDVRNILRDYLYDNRLTLVDPRPITDKFPFLIDPIVCIYYNGSYLPGRPNSSVFHEMMWNFLKYDEFLDDAHEFSFEERKFIDNFFRVYLAFSVIRNLDLRGSPRPFSADLPINASEQHLFPYLEKFLKTGTTQEKTERAWDEMKPYFIGRNGSENSKVYYIDPHNICFSPTMSIDLNQRNQSIVYALDGLRNLRNRAIELSDEETIQEGEDEEEDDPRFTRSLGATMYFAEAEPVHVTPVETDSVFRSSIEVFIRNNALIDQSQLGGCNRKFLIKNECSEYMKLEMVERNCDCLPLTLALRRNYSKGNPICTPSTYENCNAKVQKAFSKFNETQECSPCLHPKNSYTILMLPEISMERVQEWNQSIWYYRYLHVYKCADKAMLVFEQRNQFSLSQFISQIGGDLGLYLGFSMVGLLQLILTMIEEGSGEETRRENGEAEGVGKRLIRRLVDDGREVRRLEERVDKRLGLISAEMKELKEMVSRLSER